MRAKGDLDASRRVLAALHDASPPVARLRAELGHALGLPSVYASVAELERLRAEYAANLASFMTSYPAEQVVRLGASPEDVSWSNFQLAYQGEDDRHLQTQFGDWLSETLALLVPDCAAPLSASRRARPRLAFVSSSFYRCTIGFYFSSWIEYLAQRDWEVVVVHVGTHRDQLTERLGRIAQAEITLDGDLAAKARQLRALSADLIVYPELGMDREVFALAALRLAPRQACAWGHPVTSGLPTIDAFFSCAEMEPDDATAHYRERLMTLPGLGTRYIGPQVPDAPPRAALGLPAGRSLYLVPQALFKLHPQQDAVLVEIVRRDPTALFVLFELRPPSGVRRMRERLVNALGAVSAQPERHLHWLKECPRMDYLRINAACDVMVDSLHWSGGNATLDALHCGLPVIACPGRFMRSRQSAAMLAALDCVDLVAQSAADLAERAVAIAQDPPRRAEFAARIRSNLPQLTRSAVALEALDDTLRAWLAEDVTQH